MSAFETRLDHLDWADIGRQMDAEGYAVLPGLLGRDEARDLARQATAISLHRAALASSGLGRGELFYFDADLPAPLAQWRAALYRRLAIIANRWNETLGVGHRYPATFEAFLQCNREAGQTRAQSQLNRLIEEDHLTLHQRNDGAQVFPTQIVAVLSEPGVDFQGGEFVRRLRTAAM